MPPAGGPGGRRRFGRGRARPPEQPQSPEAARGKAIGLLARRDYPAKLLRSRLTESGYEPQAAEAAVTSLETERLVNDQRYVEAAVAGRVSRGQGPIRIALELRRQGVAADLVAAAVAARDPQWLTRAADLRRRRFGEAAPADARERARQVRFLLQRGFAGDHVRHALGAAHDPDLGLDLEAGDLDQGPDDADD
jgi:regulatory protein